MNDKRTRRERAAAGELAWWEKSLFSFMGPPQLGQNKAPEGFRPDPADELCGKCGQRWEAHERAHTGSVTYRRCPASQH